MQTASDALKLADFVGETACRLCGKGALYSALDLGLHALPDFSQKTADNWQYAPLVLGFCSECEAVQLKHTVSRDVVFRRYWYRSGVSETMRAALKDVVDAGRAWVQLEKGDIVLDIGSNDGTLLSHFPDAWTMGFEPSDIPSEHGDCIVKEYFSSGLYLGFLKPAKLIFSIAMFYSVPDPNTFVAGIKEVLAADGAWVVQMNDAASMVAQNAYDFIGHEHVIFYTAKRFMELASQHGLQVFHAERNMVNGGSLRLFVCHAGKREASKGLWKALQWEKGVLYARGSLSRAMLGFVERVKANQAQLYDMVRDAAAKGVVHVYGASTRGCTILQASPLADEELLAAAAERDERKWGCLVPGTNIPIISEEESRKASPAYYLLNIYPYLEQVKQREAEFLERGGQFILPLPIPKMVGK